MKKFLIKIVLVSLLPLIAFYCFIASYADGNLDPFYLRFTSGKQSSLIIGSSRAAQGIRPDVLNKLLDAQKFEGPFYNYSFTISHSPYGPTYLNAINKKLEHSTKNGIFIMSVDPWSLITENENLFDNEKLYGENKLPPGNMFTHSMNPNFEYILKNYNKPFRTMTFNDDTTSLLHEDGWLEIRVQLEPKKLAERTKKKIKEYNSKLTDFFPSRKRLYYLNELIALLNKHGDVYMIRMPLGKEISLIEDEFWPDFDADMIEIALKNKISYSTFRGINHMYNTIDGNHLFKEDAARFSELICDSILNKYK